MRFILTLLLALTGPPLHAQERLEILAIGDSVMAWQAWTGRDIPSEIEDRLGANVDSEAVPGARFSNTSAFGSALGFDVRGQFKAGPWDIILVNGGANDLLSECRCSDCDTVVDGLIAADLSGEIPRFMAELRETGAEIIWMGYYASYRSGQFAGCRAYIVEMERRIARLDGIHFIDSEDVIDRQDRRLFAVDGIHPSAAGTARIGTYLAERIAALVE